MKRYLGRSRLMMPLITGAVIVCVGCQGSVESNNSDAGAAVEQAANDVADAVTPDKDIVDIDTPLADVNVSEDEPTGRKKVEVNTE